MKEELASRPSPNMAAINKANEANERKANLEDIIERLKADPNKSLEKRIARLEREVAEIDDYWYVGGGREWPTPREGEGSRKGRKEGGGGGRKEKG